MNPKKIERENFFPKPKNPILFFMLVFFVFAHGFSQNAKESSKFSAKTLVEQAKEQQNLAQSIKFLQKNVEFLENPSEKRVIYDFLGSICEQVGFYGEASQNFVKAAALQGGDVEGFAKKTSEELILDATRCALSAGDSESAKNYISAIKNSKSQKTLAFCALFEQLAALCDAKTSQDTNKVVEILKTYANLPSMSAAEPQILFTLWQLTAEKSYAQQLTKKFPKSAESLIVQGKIQLSAVPFWYFSARLGDGIPDPENFLASESKNDEKPEKSDENSAIQTFEKPARQQLGLFKNENNAKSLVQKLQAQDFDAKIFTEKRPSGNVYFIVAVDENAEGTIGAKLRSAGYECYPIFE